MERKIGEIFEYDGEWYQCINTGNCSECAFTGKRCYDFSTKGVDIIGDCTGRTFKKLEKVGEPYMDGGKIMQKYNRVYREPIYFPYKELNCYNDLHGRICIEIKQNKDMEDNKLNLRPFDIQKAREGKPVCTRSGHKVRIICFDYNGETGDYPIVALVSYYKGNNFYERVLKYTSDGLFNKYGDYKHDDDLMMPTERKEGWVNVYKSSVCISVYPRIYKSREEAVSDNTAVNRIDTVRISWGGIVMAWVAVDKDGTENIFQYHPKRSIMRFIPLYTYSMYLTLPKGTIKKLIGRDRLEQ